MNDTKVEAVDEATRVLIKYAEHLVPAPTAGAVDDGGKITITNLHDIMYSDKCVLVNDHVHGFHVVISASVRSEQ